jgi:VWFA-related protein
VVIDKEGRSLAGLTRDDFTLKEDGALETIDSFEAIQVLERPEPPPAPAPLTPRVTRRISSNTERPPSTGREFTIVFDELHLTPVNAGYARTAVAEFLRDGVQAGDLVTLVATGSSVWRSVEIPGGREELLAALEGLEGRFLHPEALRNQITDYEALRIYVYDDRQVANRVERRFAARGVIDPAGLEERLDPDFYESQRQFIQPIDPLVRMRAADAYRMATVRTRTALQVMERAVQAQALRKGRKSLIFVSEGFVYDTELEEIKRVGEAARRSNVAVYFVDARGLKGLPGVFSAETRMTGDPRSSFSEIQDVGANIFQMAQEAAGSETVASESGGFSIKNTNDLASGIRRIGDESRNYYLLGYTPTKTARDGKFRKIKVEVRGEDLTVRARKGYYAPREGEERRPRGPDADVQQALDAAHPLPDIPLRMTSYVLGEATDGKAEVLVATDVDIRALAFEETEGRFVDTLEYLLVVVHRETNEYFRYDEKADMKLLPETRERLATTWYPIVRDFELPAGPYRAKIVVRDRANAQIGTVIHDFDVPSLDRWRMSTPILSETLDRGEGEGARPRATPSARRVYAPGEALYCEFQVFDAARDPATGLPHVASGHSLQDGRGSTLFVAEPTAIRPSSLGTVSRIIGLSTQGLSPGDYALTVFVLDQVTGEAIEVLEPFRLVAPDGPERAASSGG